MFSYGKEAVWLWLAGRQGLVAMVGTCTAKVLLGVRVLGVSVLEVRVP